MKRQTIDKRNLIKLVNHHRKYCDGENCDISLILVLEMAERSGIHFTKNQRRYFL